jgi:hypothetical protein
MTDHQLIIGKGGLMINRTTVVYMLPVTMPQVAYMLSVNLLSCSEVTYIHHWSNKINGLQSLLR